MPERINYHMTPDEFRCYGREVVDWIATYYERVEEFPVLSTVQPGDIRAALPQSPPEKGERFDQILQDLDKIILPGITHWQSQSGYCLVRKRRGASTVG